MFICHKLDKRWSKRKKMEKGKPKTNLGSCFARIWETLRISAFISSIRSSVAYEIPLIICIRAFWLGLEERYRESAKHRYPCLWWMWWIENIKFSCVRFDAPAIDSEKETRTDALFPQQSFRCRLNETLRKRYKYGGWKKKLFQFVAECLMSTVKNGGWKM